LREAEVPISIVTEHKQQIQSTKLTEVELRSMVSKAVAVAMDAQEVVKEAEEAKEDFQAGQW